MYMVWKNLKIWKAFVYPLVEGILYVLVIIFKLRTVYG